MMIMLAAGAEGEERGVSIMLFVVPFFLLDYLAIMETGILLL